MKLFYLICLIAIIYFIVIAIKPKVEKFTIEQVGKLYIKKNNKYTLVYKNKKFSVWEVEPIDNYFPIGQKITLNSKPPLDDDILVNSNMINYRPKISINTKPT